MRQTHGHAQQEDDHAGRLQVGDQLLLRWTILVLLGWMRQAHGHAQQEDDHAGHLQVGSAIVEIDLTCFIWMD